MFNPLQQAIENTIRLHDRSFGLLACHAVGGGSISSAWRYESREKSYFVKLNRAECAHMFAAEAEGLSEMAQAGAVRVPHPLCHGLAEGKSFLVCEWLPLGGSSQASAAVLGRQLADMHRHTRADHGWRRDNTIGSTVQLNSPCSDWCAFWRDHRLGFQLQLASHNGFDSALLNKGERLMAALDVLLAGHVPEASLLHGDLWGGNWGVIADGTPVLFDPAVYYGDREADIAMTGLFGGFPEAFYAAYRECWPLDEGYEMRRTLYNLYHILNHVNLFGGGYAAQAMGMMDRLLAEAG
ncbi:MAG: hypothetical protein AUK36_05915 [Zetaproteobacteria bacterium CG2_30_59_37]|nr:MAG: hypothetical protein AUK36_05915 [Zetaproteobacteria bacterium CG2_30_59_37]